MVSGGLRLWLDCVVIIQYDVPVNSVVDCGSCMHNCPPCFGGCGLFCCFTGCLFLALFGCVLCIVLDLFSGCCFNFGWVFAIGRLC